MRYSAEKALKIVEVPPQWSNERFFAAVHKGTAPEMWRGALLLVGGVDFRARAVRQAQAPLRLDRLPSAWSHAALLLQWPAPLKGQGAEVALDPQDIALQLPEQNGVTVFHLARYFDGSGYPNLCIAALDVDEKSAKQSDKEANKRLSADFHGKRTLIADAAFHPNRDRVRFPLWDWLGVWAHYLYTAAGAANPVTQGIPLPGAAFCEYAYEAAGLDLTPGATAPNACPEILWATIKHWHQRIGEEGIRMKAWRILRDPAPPYKRETRGGREEEVAGLEKDPQLRALKAHLEKELKRREQERKASPGVNRPRTAGS